MDKKAYISEIFTSIQGEGLQVGRPAIFIRFAGCNLNCSYCDTAHSKTRKNAREYSLRELVSRIQKAGLSEGDVCITGGEPLLQADFLVQLIPELKRRGFKISMETNGTLTEEFKKVARQLDVLAISAKSPSSGNRFSKEDYRKFLHGAVNVLGKTKRTNGKRNVFVKMVITGNTSSSEVRDVAGIIASVHKGIPLVLQPVTTGQKTGMPGAKALLALQREARKRLVDVRVIPQVHKVLGLR